MKKLIVTALLGLTTFTYANVNAVVSILPQETFLKKIGADKVNVSLMVKPGKSPHTYEPKPSQMRDISKADIYFSIGVEFEHVWLKKFQNQNKKMIVADMGEGIHKIEMAEHSHHHDEDEHKEEKHHDHDAHDHAKKDNHNDEAKHDDHEEHDDHDEDSLDPHIWLSPSNVKVMAHNIYNQLVKIDSKNKDYYKKNLDAFLKEITQTDKTIKDHLKNTPKHTKFMVFHPSWGYFAKDYNLEQFAIESGGKNPKPKQLAHLIEEAKEENVKAVFTAPEFSTNSAKQIAKEVGIPVVKVSPLSASWSENLIGLAKAISNK